MIWNRDFLHNSPPIAVIQFAPKSKTTNVQKKAIYKISTAELSSDAILKKFFTKAIDMIDNAVNGTKRTYPDLF